MSNVIAKTNPAPHKTANNGHTPPPRTFEGKLVSMTGNHMVISNMEGQKCSYTLAKNATLTCDGTDCGTEQLKSGGKIRVTTRLGERNVATGIESLDKHSEFAEKS